MPVEQTYPSPNAAQIGHGANPFYAQHQLHTSEEIEFSTQLHQEEGPSIIENARVDHANLQDLRQAQLNSPQPNFAQQPARPSQISDQGPSTDDAVTRKKSKTSRACDECRRKKIKCDAEAETLNADKCSNCKRTQTTCQFSRVPMKRGPSKGYIKELADRLQRVEQSVSVPNMIRSPDLQDATMNHGGSSAQGHGHPSTNDGTDAILRKRTHSVLEESPQQAYMHAQLQNMSPGFPSAGGWSGNDAPSQVQQQQHHGYPNKIAATTGYSGQFSAPSHRSRISSNNDVPISWRRKSTGIIHGWNEARFSEVDSVAEVSFPWDEPLIDEYYRIIHPVYPMIAHSKQHLKTYLGKTPASVRLAFLEAVNAVISSCPGALVTTPSSAQTNKIAHELLNSYQYETDSPHKVLAKLVFIQASMLMVLALDMSGPSNYQIHPGVSKDIWLGMATGMTKSLKLHDTRTCQEHFTDDVDSLELVARRTWWSLVIMERWHACGTTTPLSIPDSIVELAPGDAILLGESVYNFARLSLILGHISEIFLCVKSLPSPMSPNGLIISRLLSGEISRFRESFNKDRTLTSLPLVHLSFWHLLLLQKRHTPSLSSELDDIIGSSKIMATMLSADNSFSPLTHHFAALSALTLTELLDVQKAQKDALGGLATLSQAIETGRIISSAAVQEGAVGWDIVILEHIQKKVQHVQQQQQSQAGNDSGSTIDRGGLQHLADLAVGESEGAASTTGEKIKEDAGAGSAVAEIDWTVLTSSGYLNAFG